MASDNPLVSPGIGYLGQQPGPGVGGHALAIGGH